MPKLRPAGSEPDLSGGLPAQIAGLRSRAEQAGDAMTLLEAQFGLAQSMAGVIQHQLDETGEATAAMYRELRMLLADIVRVIETREERTLPDSSVAKLEALLRGV